MSYIQQGVLQSAEERTRFRHAPRFAPAGQSTQMIVGATDESDRDILLLSSALYGRPTMKRVYYSGFIPVNPYDKRLPALDKAPLVRENRLYQADWLMRFYGFRAEEIADEQTSRLDLEIDPKLAWALRNPAFFPVDVNRADYEALLRVPGIGVKSARLIVASRRYRTLTQQSLRQIGVVMKKAQYFICCRELTTGQGVNELRPEQVRRLLTAPQRRKQDRNEGQLTLSDAMLVFRYDKSFDGLLSALFDAYSLRAFPEALIGPGEPEPLFTERVHEVATDGAHADRVWGAWSGG